MATTQIYCPSCGTPCSPEANFCLRCGKALPKIDVSVSVSQTPDFITLACPNCGGSLKITPDMERFACHYCGLEHMVRRESGVVSLAPVVEGLRRVENKFDHILSGSDRLAAEQTLQRLNSEIPELEKKIAEKELILKTYSPGIQSCGIALSMLAMLSCTLLAFLIGFDYFYLYLVPLVMLILGLVILQSAGTTDKKTYEVAKIELPKLKTELQNRKQQASQLHNYTVERQL